MISNLKTFENKNFGKLTVIEKDGEFFFIANEVATMLGYVNPRKAVYDHVDEEDKGVTKWNTPGGIGYISNNNTLDFNIVIRTAVIEKDKTTLGVGGAIVNLSDEEEEFDEILLKAKGALGSVKEYFGIDRDAEIEIDGGK